jgi:acetyl-CoA carboxylase biotin carboxyl carrier protein
MIDNKRLRQLIELMSEHGITELDLRDQEGQITLKRGPSGGMVPMVAASMPAALAQPVAAVPAPAAAPADDGLKPIASPMVGTFYAAPSPDAEPFVRVGTRVGPDTVVCILEAMKVFNEIKAECSGTIQKIAVASGQAVEFGQPLFLIKPD